MSASEKLKALDAVVPEHDGDHRTQQVLAALPQIVAVIESAERETGMEADTEEAQMRNVPRLRAALSALDEALS